MAKSFPYWMRALLLLILLVLLVVGGWFYHSQQHYLRKEIESDLLAIAELKMNQVTTWNRERLGDANLLTQNSLLSEKALEYLHHPQPDAAAALRSDFENLQRFHDYSGVLLVDIDGRVLLNVNNDPDDFHEKALETLSDAVREQHPLLTDLHLDRLGTSPHISVVAPLFSGEGESRKAFGAIILVSDAEQFPSRSIPPRSTRSLRTWRSTRVTPSLVWVNSRSKRKM